MKFVIFFFAFCLPSLALASTFVVTNNADSGPGSLRQAILDAAVNGATVTDQINFAIPGTSEDERTIILQSELPGISSNLVIDGSTQPGLGFGVSQAKVCLKLTTKQTSFFFFSLNNVNNISIYGLFFYQSYWNFSDLTNNSTEAIRIKKSNNIIIGKPGKGNYFIGTNFGISNYTPYTYDGYTANDSCRGITIQSNIAGLDEIGGTRDSYNGEIIFPIQTFLNFTYAKDILLGGLNPGEGNYIKSSKPVNYQTKTITGNGFFYIQNNRFGTNIDDTIILNGSSGSACEIWIRAASSSDVPTFDTELDFRGNILIGNLWIIGPNKDYAIQSNKIYTTSAGWGSSSSGNNEMGLITVAANGNKIKIGGETDAEGNTIFGNNYNSFFGSLGHFAINTLGVGFFNIPSGVEIKHNKMYCNSGEWSTIYNQMEYPPYKVDENFSWVVIDSTANGFVKGRSARNNRIDIYQDDECRACEGKLFLGSTVADNMGQWSYSGNFTGVVVALATDNYHSHTSSFSSPIIFIDSIKIQQPSCGKQLGFIKGATMLGGDNVEWRYSTDRFITNSVYFANTLDIENLQPGTYWLMGKLGNTCYGWKRQFDLTDFTPKIIDTYVSLQQPACGLFSGSVTGIGANGDQFCRFEWRNEAGMIVGTEKNLSEVGPGTYKFFVIDTTGGGCIDSSKAYLLVNQSGPSLKTAGMVITPATCSQSNGAINNIGVQNATGIQFFKWEDSTGKAISNTLNLQNAAAGKYRLKFKDGYTCDTIVTPFYTITNLGEISIDTSLRIVSSSKCSQPTGSISGTKVTGGSEFAWLNIATSQTAGNSVGLVNVPSGYYQLLVSNATGCSKSIPAVYIPQNVLSPIVVNAFDSLHANCLQDNGMVKAVSFSVNPSVFSFQWRNISTNALVSNTTSALNLAQGTYALVAKDTNNCTGEIYRATIQQLGKPVFDVSGIAVINDSCNLGVGKINNVQVTGGSGGYTWQWKKNGVTVGSGSGQLTNLKEGSYIPVVKDKNGCEVLGPPFSISGIDIQLPVPLADDQYILRNTVAHIVIRNSSSGRYTLFKDDVPTSPVASSSGGTIVTPPVPASSTYYLRHEKGTCVSALKPIIVKVFDRSIIKMPNAFSPNGDGVNDIWLPVIQGIIIIKEWRVFNRYGQQVFTSTDAARGWDGKINGTTAPIGTYYWIITALDNNNTPITSSGSVTIVK